MLRLRVSPVLVSAALSVLSVLAMTLAGSAATHWN